MPDGPITLDASDVEEAPTLDASQVEEAPRKQYLPAVNQAVATVPKPTIVPQEIHADLLRGRDYTASNQEIADQQAKEQARVAQVRAEAAARGQVTPKPQPYDVTKAIVGGLTDIAAPGTIMPGGMGTDVGEQTGAGTRKMLTPGQRTTGALQTGAGVLEAAAPLAGPMAVENPLTFARAMGEGYVAGKGAKYGVKAVGGTPEQQGYAEDIGQLSPMLAHAALQPVGDYLSEPYAPYGADPTELAAGTLRSLAYKYGIDVPETPTTGQLANIHAELSRRIDVSDPTDGAALAAATKTIGGKFGELSARIQKAGWPTLEDIVAKTQGGGSPNEPAPTAIGSQTPKTAAGRPTAGAQPVGPAPPNSTVTITQEAPPPSLLDQAVAQTGQPPKTPLEAAVRATEVANASDPVVQAMVANAPRSDIADYLQKAGGDPDKARAMYVADQKAAQDAAAPSGEGKAAAPEKPAAVTPPITAGTPAKTPIAAKPEPAIDFQPTAPQKPTPQPKKPSESAPIELAANQVEEAPSVQAGSKNPSGNASVAGPKEAVSQPKGTESKVAPVAPPVSLKKDQPIALPDGRTGTIKYVSPADKSPVVTVEIDGKTERFVGQKEVSQLKAAEPKYKFGNTQAPIHPDSEASKALESARSRISDSDLAGKGKDIGDGGNHVTVRYGHMGASTEELKKFLSQQAPFEASLGKTESFPPSEHSDGAAVIQAPIEAPELHRLNSEIEKHGEFAPSSFPEFRPHATIGYVRPAVADRYVGMDVTDGKKFLIDRIAITDRNGNQSIVRLEGQRDTNGSGGQSVERSSAGRGVPDNGQNAVSGAGTHLRGREADDRAQGGLSGEGRADTAKAPRPPQVPSSTVHELGTSGAQATEEARLRSQSAPNALRERTSIRPPRSAGVERVSPLRSGESAGVSSAQEEASTTRMGEARAVPTVQSERPEILRTGVVRSVLPSGEANRRQPSERRSEKSQPATERREGERRVSEMTHSELKKAALEDYKSGGAFLNERAWKEREPLPHMAITDVDGLGAVNDKFGHEAGDHLIKAYGEAFRRAGIKAYRIGGDEVMAQGETPEQLKAQLEAAREHLKGAKIHFKKDGEPHTLSGVDFSYGIGPDEKTSDSALYQHKREREASGDRAQKGQLGRNVVVAKGHEADGLSSGVPAGEVKPTAEEPTKAEQTFQNDLEKRVDSLREKIKELKKQTSAPAVYFQDAKKNAAERQERSRRINQLADYQSKLREIETAHKIELAKKLTPEETVPKEGKNFEGRYVRASLEPVKEAWMKKWPKAEGDTDTDDEHWKWMVKSFTDGTDKPIGFKKGHLYIKVPGDGSFYIPNVPNAIDHALKAAGKFAESKVGEALPKAGPKKFRMASPKEFDNAKYIAGLEKEIKELENEQYNVGDLQKPYIREQLKAARENLAEAKAGEKPESLLAGESGAFTPAALAPSAIKKTYDSFISKAIDKKLDLGDKYQRVAEHDPEIAKALHEKDNAPRYFHDKAESNVEQVIKGLSEEQIRLASMMVDNQTREYLEENHPEQFDQAQNDPAVMKAVKTFKKYQDELAAVRISLGWHVRRDLSMEESEDGTWKIIDQDGNETGEEFKSAKKAQEYVEENGKILDHLKRTYPEHLREPLMGRTDEGPSLGGSYGGIKPPRPDKKQRIASAEYFYQHGAKDFGGYIKSFTQAYHAALNQKIYDSLTDEATKWKRGTAMPPQIEYRGETYYSPDIAKSMKMALPANRPKKILEYKAYDPAKDDRALIKDFENGWSTQTTGRPGISPLDRWLAPAEVVDALERYDMTRGVKENDTIRRFFQDQIVGLFGPTVHVLNIMRRLATTVGAGAWDPRVWPYYQKLFFSKELRERMAQGLADDAIDHLSKWGSYTNTRDIGSLHEYFLGNLNPANWVRQTVGKFSKGILFDPKFLGGLGGLDQKARVLAYDYLRQNSRRRPAGGGGGGQEPPNRPNTDAWTDEEAAKRIEDAFGNYNKANWTERMKRWARALLFPGWDFSSLKWFLRHPIRTAFLPALATMGANLAINASGGNKNSDKYDFAYIHYGDRKYRTGLVTESMAMHFAEPILEAVKSALEGGDVRDISAAAGQGALRGGGGLAGNLRPEIQAVAELLSNGQYMGGEKEIWKPEDANIPGKVLPTKKLDEMAAFTVVKALPAVSRFLDNSYANVDVATGAGSIVGVTNYRSGAEERLKANEAKAMGYSQTLSKLAETEPPSAEKFVQDPNKSVYLMFNQDFSELAKDLKTVDTEIERVKMAADIKLEDRKSTLETLKNSRVQLLNSADAINDQLDAARMRLKSERQ